MRKIKKIGIGILAGVLAATGTFSGSGLEAGAAGNTGMYKGIIYTGGTNTGAGLRNACLSPRIIQLEYQADSADNGKMYATFECGQLPKDVGSAGGALPDSIDGELPAFPVYESLDGGYTWSDTPVGYIQDSENGWGLMNCPQIYELPGDLGELKAGTLICVGNSVNIQNDLTPTSMELSYSTDLGRTWKYYGTVAIGGKNVMGDTPVWEPYLLYQDGTLYCYYSDETHPDYGQILVHKSSQDGKTWSEADNDLLDGQRPGMPVLTQLADGTGRWAMIYEAEGGGYSGLKISDTSDPESFAELDRGMYVRRGGSPFITTLDTGALVTSGVGETDVTINSRKDGLGEWIHYKTNVKGGAHNKQLKQLASGELMIVCGGGFETTHEQSIEYSILDINTSGLFKDGSYVNLERADNNQNIGSENDGYTENTNALAWDANGGWSQKWVLEEADGGYVYIQNALAGRMLSVADDEETVILKEQDETLTHQLWKQVENTDGTSTFVNAQYADMALTIGDKGDVISITAYAEDSPSDGQRILISKAADSPQPYEVTVTSTQGGQVSKSGTFLAHATEAYDITIQADSGYQIASVKVNGEERGAAQKITLTPVKDADGNNMAQTVSVEFEKESGQYYYITSGEEDQKVAAVDGGSTADGTRLIEWANNGGLDQQWSVAEADDAKGCVRLVNRKSGLVMAASEGAEGSGVIQTALSSGDKKQLWTLKEADNGYYTLENAAAEGCVLSRGTGTGSVIPLIISSPAGEPSEGQRWSLDDAALNQTCNYSAFTTGGGNIDPKEKGSVKAGSSKTFTLIPDEGFCLADVTVNGQSVMEQTEISGDGTGTYTYSNVRESFTIIGVFRKSFTITVDDALENGSIILDSSAAAQGSSVTFTVVPDEGYEIADVLVDGQSVGAVTSYTLENIQENHSISAVFRLKDDGQGGAGSGAGSGSAGNENTDNGSAGGGGQNGSGQENIQVVQTGDTSDITPLFTVMLLAAIAACAAAVAKVRKYN